MGIINNITIEKVTIKKESDFNSLQPLWITAYNDSDMTVYQSFNWNLLLVREWMKFHYERLFCSIEVYIGRRGNNIMILPLLIQSVSMNTKWVGRKKGMFLLGHRSYSDYLNFIYNGFDEQIVEALLRAVKEGHKGLKLYLTDIRDDTLLSKYLAGKGTYEDKSTVSVSVRLQDNPVAYTASLSKHVRQNLRTALNRMNKEDFLYEHLFFEGVIQDPVLLDELLSLHISRMSIKNNNKEDFVHRISSAIRIKISINKEKNNNIITSSMRLMENSCLVMVRLNGNLCGYLYGLRDNRTIRIMQNCVNDEYKFYSPMFRGAYDFICDCHGSETIDEIDFTRGNEAYKYQLGGIETRLHHFMI